jgi:hypothetical protein
VICGDDNDDDDGSDDSDKGGDGDGNNYGSAPTLRLCLRMDVY